MGVDAASAFFSYDPSGPLSLERVEELITKKEPQIMGKELVK